VKSSLANLSIAVKLFIAPAIAILLLSMTAPLVLSSLASQARLLERLTTIEVEKSATLAALARTIPEASSLANRLVGLASNSSDAAAIKRLSADLDKHLGDAASLIVRLSGFEMFDGEKEIVAGLGEDMKSYSTASHQVAVMAAEDAGMAYMLTSNGERVYTGLLGKLDALRDLEHRRATAAHDQSMAQTEKARIEFIALFGAAAVVAVLLTTALSRMISGSITRLTTSTLKLAGGDLTVEVEGGERKDEIGSMARAVQVFKDSAHRTLELEREHEEARMRRAADDEMVRSQAERTAAAEAAALVVGSIGAGLERLAAGDLTFRLEAKLPAAYEKLRTDLNATVSNLLALATGIVESSAGINSSSDEIHAAADELSKRTEQQAANLQETAASLDEITATVNQTAAGSKHARDVVSAAKVDAERSGVVVRDAVAAMNGIDKSSKQISQIIGVIDEIAFQTNLLALNAGVEAARAGDAGRGFAVVASEVRALAQRSAQAAKEIKALISTSTGQVDQGVGLVVETGKALERIAAQVADIDSVVSAISASTQEQATALHEVNAAVNQMDQVTQQNVAMVEETTAAAAVLAQETGELLRLVGRFEIGDSHAAAAAPPRRSAAKAAPIRRQTLKQIAS
jgi:methyl-accepting chemotaxis protein